MADTLEVRFPKVAKLLLDAEDEVLAYMVFPARHSRQIQSTNPLERLHKELKRRAHVVGIFPNRASVLRLMGAVLMEQNDEWATGRRHFSAESMAEIGRREVNASIATAAN
ncbi:MAG: transposase [Firmicutes bacterium]|nr:transposase [Bacillota bacterium]